jgi:hypothetical protein
MIKRLVFDLAECCHTQFGLPADFADEGYQGLRADLDANGDVGFSDFLYFADAYGRVAVTVNGAPTDPSTVQVTIESVQVAVNQ